MTDQGQWEKFIVALTEFGGSAGNGKLREALGWDKATYDSIKQTLIAEGAIASGRGRGGSVSRGPRAPANRPGRNRCRKSGRRPRAPA